MAKMNLKQKSKIEVSLPIISSTKRLLILKNLKSIWKNKKPDPIKQLEKLRKEWERI